MSPDLALVAVLVAVALLWRHHPRRRPRPPSHSPLYQTYMRSAAWKQRRATELARAGYRCTWHRGLFRCRTRRGLSVHHWTYEHLGAEWEGELQVLCRRHHAQADIIRRRQERRRRVRRRRARAGR